LRVRWSEGRISACSFEAQAQPLPLRGERVRARDRRDRDEPGLQAKLAAAQGHAARGNRTAAASQLEAFVNEVEALVRTGLTAAEGQALVAEAREIAAQLRAGL